MKKILVGLAALGGLALGAPSLAAGLDRMGEADCARTARGDAADPRQASERMMAVMEHLQPATITEWFELSYRAAAAQLRSAPEAQRAVLARALVQN
jgi:hypothetical protein